MKEYRALRAFPYGNSHADKGAVVRLSDKQAEYLRAGGYIEPTEPAAAPKKSTAKSPKPSGKTGDDGQGTPNSGGQQ
ncbi:hypothetical protein [Castellaniella sp. S9]|uniref:hypothetical protein n=1 Tax=Castellaniella sp. S9 TaxID=2993652 RepID=UPI0022B4DF3D|nr:hypothetical protein [Castellaniella sp. S9]